MADFDRGGVSCTFTDSLADGAAAEMIRRALRVPEQAVRNPETHRVDEDKYTAMCRAFSNIAAHSKNVKGFPGWVDINMFTPVELIEPAAQHFLASFGKKGFPLDLYLHWQNTMNIFLYGISTLAYTREEAEATGDVAKAFLSSAANALLSGSPTPPPVKRRTSPSRTQKSKTNTLKQA